MDRLNKWPDCKGNIMKYPKILTLMLLGYGNGYPTLNSSEDDSKRLPEVLGLPFWPNPDFGIKRGKRTQK